MQFVDPQPPHAECSSAGGCPRYTRQPHPQDAVLADRPVAADACSEHHLDAELFAALAHQGGLVGLAGSTLPPGNSQKPARAGGSARCAASNRSPSMIAMPTTTCAPRSTVAQSATIRRPTSRLDRSALTRKRGGMPQRLSEATSRPPVATLDGWTGDGGQATPQRAGADLRGRHQARRRRRQGGRRASIITPTSTSGGRRSHSPARRTRPAASPSSTSRLARQIDELADSNADRTELLGDKSFAVSPYLAVDIMSHLRGPHGRGDVVPPVIRVEALVKEFRRTKKQEGRFGNLRTLFTRQFETVRAVDDINFAIEPGELVGYIGPNGAGKSTTIKMMTGILVPTSGTVEVGGIVPWRDREHNAMQIGVVFGQRSQLWWDLPLIESFKLVGKLYRVPEAIYERNLDRFIALLDMEEFLERPVRQLSLGQRMRGDLAASMLYEPRILYLDEPTIGLDIVAKENMRLFIEEMNRDSGTTIVLTTHDLADVERLCQRLILIDHGHVLYDGGVEQLKAKYAPHRILVVELEADADGAAVGSTRRRAGSRDRRAGRRRRPHQVRNARTPVQDLIGA